MYTLGNVSLLSTKIGRFFFKSNFRFVSDVTDYASFDNLVKQIDGIVGDAGLNVILNNAGIFPNKDKSDSTRDDLMTTLEVNSIAPLMLTRVSCYYCPKKLTK